MFVRHAIKKCHATTLPRNQTQSKRPPLGIYLMSPYPSPPPARPAVPLRHPQTPPHRLACAAHTRAPPTAVAPPNDSRRPPPTAHSPPSFPTDPSSPQSPRPLQQGQPPNSTCARARPAPPPPPPHTHRSVRSARNSTTSGGDLAPRCVVDRFKRARAPTRTRAVRAQSAGCGDAPLLRPPLESVSLRVIISAAHASPADGCGAPFLTRGRQTASLTYEPTRWSVPGQHTL